MPPPPHYSVSDKNREWIRLELEFPESDISFFEAALYELDCIGIVQKDAFRKKGGGGENHLLIEAWFLPGLPEKIKVILLDRYNNYLKYRDKLYDLNVSFERVKAQNWMENWKRYFTVCRISEHLAIAPAWIDYAETEQVIQINPGQAFGTGSHPTTQISLMLMESVNIKDKMVLDLGCGSGILSIYAALQDASFVLGIDNDAMIIENIIENLRLNSSRFPSAKMFPERLAFAITEISELNTAMKFDYIVCNVLLSIMESLAPNFPMILSENPKSRVLVSGFLLTERSEAEKLFANIGFICENFLELDEWGGFLLRRKEIL